ncbi:SUKH-4 family immunity protein [Streptomyces sp. NPDC015125]|uniref:SUKH-4 family immunity protein n=1 Tax=Streptomyces sp. NPDC015125 TaxID=3364938 RepID=UPI0036F7EEEA
MPQLVNRVMMESAFSPGGLVTPEEDKLPAELDEPARSLLVNVGLPDDRSFFFVIDGGFFEGEAQEIPHRFRRCAELDCFSEYEDMPRGWENWLLIGEIHHDAVALDPVSGVVYCLPDDGEFQARVLNRNLDSFLFFLYLLASERPHDDFRGACELDDTERVAASLRERMAGADPLPFDGVEPAWSEGFDWSEDAPRLPTWECVLWDVHEAVGQAE